MGIDDHLEELKEKEIIRLSTPLTRKKINGKPDEIYDCEGNLVANTNNTNYILEPNNQILSNEEILKYAPRSNEASKVRLKMGIADLNDKIKIYWRKLIWIFPIALLLAIFGFSYSFNLGIALIISVILCLVFFLFIYDFKDEDISDNVKVPKVHINDSYKTSIKENNMSSNDELLLLFESKEKIAREMIEKKFQAPQITNSKFNGVLDECHDVVVSQIEILNALTPTDKTKFEIESRKKLIKQVISKIDDLTNELILSEESNLEVVIEEMDNLINSVKEYV